MTNTWSSLLSSIDGAAEALNDDLQRLSKFLLLNINRANFTSRPHNNNTVHRLIVLPSLSFCFRLRVTLSWIYSIFTLYQQHQHKFSSPYRLSFALVWLPLSSAFAVTLPLHESYSTYYPTTTAPTTMTSITLSPYFRYQPAFAFMLPFNGFSSITTR